VGIVGIGSGAATYRLVSTLDETKTAMSVFRKIWGPDSVNDVDTLFVAATHGGYMSVAYVDARPVAASFGLLSDRGRGLHSHMSGVLNEFVGMGIGFGLKHHQREWAAAQGIEHITWTFDPLVRRNAFFNLVRLGATVTGYRVNYYGALGDAINGNDETDRLFVSWPTQFDPLGGWVHPVENDVLIDLPHDIESIRPEGVDSGRTANQWRLHMRTELRERLETGWRIAGFSSDYRYVLRKD
jgi:predicted GNAT superfamily acetyltransferase